MKKKNLIMALMIPIAVWLAAPWVLVRYPIWVYERTCPADSTEPRCRDHLTRLGQSGDTYGAVSALFSGLALFAVAATLFADSTARRASRKPLIVSTIDDVKELTFDEPHHTSPRSVRFTANLTIKAADETALNTSISVILRVGNYRLVLSEKHVQVPLLPHEKITIEFPERLGEADIQKFVNEINSGKKILLDIVAKCRSVEGLSWKTSVVYRLSFPNNESLQRLKSMLDDEQTLLNAWQGGAAIAFKSEIEPNSWGFDEIRN